MGVLLGGDKPKPGSKSKEPCPGCRAVGRCYEDCPFVPRCPECLSDRFVDATIPQPVRGETWQRLLRNPLDSTLGMLRWGRADRFKQCEACGELFRLDLAVELRELAPLEPPPVVRGRYPLANGSQTC